MERGGEGGKEEEERKEEEKEKEGRKRKQPLVWLINGATPIGTAGCSSTLIIGHLPRSKETE